MKLNIWDDAPTAVLLDAVADALTKADTPIAVFDDTEDPPLPRVTLPARTSDPTVNFDVDGSNVRLGLPSKTPLLLKTTWVLLVSPDDGIDSHPDPVQMNWLPKVVSNTINPLSDAVSVRPVRDAVLSLGRKTPSPCKARALEFPPATEV